MARRLALLALAALVLAGCGSASEAMEPEAAAPAQAAPGGGEDAITGTDLDGEPISFAEFRGRPLLVNVWSSW